jgi:Flp pilus assembly protein TadB
MSYLAFLIFGILIAVVTAVALAGPLSVVPIVGFWVAHYYYLAWRYKQASLVPMSDSELSDVLDWWTAGGPFGRNTPDLSRVRRNGTEDQLRAALKRVIAIYDETIRRAENLGVSTTEHERKRKPLIDELSRLSKGIEPN